MCNASCKIPSLYWNNTYYSSCIFMIIFFSKIYLDVAFGIEIKETKDILIWFPSMWFKIYKKIYDDINAKSNVLKYQKSQNTVRPGPPEVSLSFVSYMAPYWKYVAISLDTESLYKSTTTWPQPYIHILKRWFEFFIALLWRQ